MIKVDKKILIFTTDFGHQSLAETASEAFEKAGWQTVVFHRPFKTSSLLYNFIYLFSPSAFQPIYDLQQNPKIIEILQKYAQGTKGKEIEKAIRNFHPAIVLSTYLLYNGPLEKLKRKYRFKLINLVADPRTFNLINLSSQAEVNLVYDQKTKKDLLASKIKVNRVEPIGWLVRKRFYRKVNRKPQKKNRLTILLCGGSLGTNAILKFLPIFLTLKKSWRLIFVTGKNKFLYQAATIFKEVAGNQKNHVEIHRYTKRIDQLMAQSDLVTGKAGPNLIFESVAAGKPFLALTHIHGQENGNLQIIEEKGLGWIAETPKEAKVLLEKITSHPELIKKKVKTVLREREGNIVAAERLIKIAEQLISFQEENA